MSTRKIYVIHCDGADLSDTEIKDGIRRLVQCSEAITGDESEPPDVVRYRAQGTGWTCDKSSYDYCPAHHPSGV